MNKLEFNLEGLSCASCVKLVTNHFMDVAGVKSVDIDLASGKAKVLGEANVSLNDLVKSLEGTHYKIVK